MYLNKIIKMYNLLKNVSILKTVILNLECWIKYF